MKIGVIGFGQAGGKIVDKLLQRDVESGPETIEQAIAINSAETDLMGLEYIPDDNRFLIGQSMTKGHGTGAKTETGREIAETDLDDVINSQKFQSIPVYDIDAFLIVAALGGGTGSGGAPVLAKQLKEKYSEPVYGVGILPDPNEGGVYSRNAAVSFQNFVDEVDSLILFDNAAWGGGSSVEGSFDEMNEQLVKRLQLLFSAGEAQNQHNVAESVVDSSEIINTLNDTGVSTIGYAEQELEKQEKSSGFLDRFRNNDTPDYQSADSENRITAAVRSSVLGRLTQPVEVSSTQKALVVIAGPPEVISRKGLDRSRKWLEENDAGADTYEVRGGDFPKPNSDKIEALTLLSGPTDIPRVKELQEIAIETRNDMDDLRETGEKELEELIETDEQIEFDDDDDFDGL